VRDLDAVTPVSEALGHLHAVADGEMVIDFPALESTLNGPFRADRATLQLIASLVRQIGPRHVISLGCDASAELLALLGFEHGRMAVTVFEHDPWAAEELIQTANALAVNYRWFAFCLCPLVARYCGNDLLPVYDDGMVIPVAPYPADLVVINGPPAELGGRSGMFYQALKYSRPGTIVLVLDARPEEDEMFEMWMRELKAHVHFAPPGFLQRHLAFVVREPLPEPFAVERPVAQSQARVASTRDPRMAGP
jgi:hypothetical protein